MSSHDTVSMVYKCMMRGAADFLIKPVRINELKNLWQHVWRRKFVSVFLALFRSFLLAFHFERSLIVVYDVAAVERRS